MAQLCSPFCSFRAEITQKESRELLCIQIRAAEVKPLFLPFHRQSNFWSHWKHRGFVTGLNRADKSPSAQSGDFFHQSQGSYETQDILLNKISFSAKSFVEYFRQIELFQWEIWTQKILELWATPAHAKAKGWAACLARGRLGSTPVESYPRIEAVLAWDSSLFFLRGFDRAQFCSHILNFPENLVPRASEDTGDQQ